MQENDTSGRIREFEGLCRERKIPVTVQRRAVLEELLCSEDHPTVDRIYQAVRTRVPDISPTTVYRVLELLVDMDLARKTCSPGSTTRYDPRTHRHHHMVCLHCDRVVDLEDPSLNDIPLPDPGRTGFRLVDYSIQFRGTCPRCQAKRTNAG